MMGREDPPQPCLFYTSFHLDKRIRPNHPLRKVAQVIDFGFVSDEVEHLYGTNGNVSIPPSVILKLLVLLVLYNVRSERELMDTLPERLDWLWFLGYDLNSEIPHHSVLSKARRRWEHRRAGEYAARKEVCLGCDLRTRCTRSRSTGRTVRRHFEQDRLDELYATLSPDHDHPGGISASVSTSWSGLLPRRKGMVSSGPGGGVVIGSRFRIISSRRSRTCGSW